MRIFCSIFFLFAWHCSVSQGLEGYWEGKFSSSNRKGWVEIDLKVERTDSNSYRIYSYSYLFDNLFRPKIDTLKVYYEPFMRDSIYLEEVSDTGYPKGAQSMWLKLKKEKENWVMRGRWEFADPGVPGGGEMYFRKTVGKIRKVKTFSY